MNGCACCPSRHLSASSRDFFYRERLLPSETSTQLLSSETDAGSGPVRPHCSRDDPLPPPTVHCASAREMQNYGAGGRTPGMSRSPTSSSMFPRSSLPLPAVDDSSDMKPRIWSIADVATSRPNKRHSVTSGHVTLTANGTGSDVASAVDVTGNARRWSNAAFHDGRAPRLTAVMTSFPPRICPLPAGGREDGSGDSAISGLGGFQRIPSFGQQHSSRMTATTTTTTTDDDLDFVGSDKMAAEEVIDRESVATPAEGRGGSIVCRPSCAAVSEVSKTIGGSDDIRRRCLPSAQSTRDPSSSSFSSSFSSSSSFFASSFSSSTSLVDPAANMAFKPFSKRIGSQS